MKRYKERVNRNINESRMIKREEKNAKEERYQRMRYK